MYNTRRNHKLAEIAPESQELVDLINQAYETASWLFIQYHVPASEYGDEETTERWVIPLTPVRCGYDNVIFTAWCRHARLEKAAEEAAEKANPNREKKSRRMHARRTFRLDRIEKYAIELVPLTEKCPWWHEMLAEYPQLAQKHGLRMKYQQTVDENGEVHGKRVLAPIAVG